MAAVPAPVPAPPTAENMIPQYTLEEMEHYLDALDAGIQAAVDDGTLIKCTFAKKEAIVSASSN